MSVQFEERKKMLSIFWILFCVTIRVNLSESRRVDETLGKFIVNATSSMLSPSTVTALLCVNDEDGFEFAKQMSRNHVMHKIWNSIEGLDPLTLRSRIGHQNFFVLDLDCPGALDILIKASENRMFVAPAQWLILQDLRSHKKTEYTSRNFENANNSDNDVSWLYKNLGNLTMFPDSQVILGRRISEDTFSILSSYRPSPQRDLILEDRGNWTLQDGLVLVNRDPASRRRRDLRQTELKSCLVLTNPDTLNHLEDYQNKNSDAVTKANYPWVLHLVNRMNATVKFTVQNTWGYRGKNGSWSGMIGLLDRREIDIGGTATFLVSERIGVVEYIQLYTPTGSKFLFRRPPLSYVSNLFTLPFGRNVWIASGVFLLLVIGLLYLAMKWEYKMKSLETGSPKVHWSANIDDEPSISNNLLVIMGAVSQQGSSYEPRAVPTRIIVLMLLVATLSLYASYTANIVALLQSTANSINTPTDLMNSPLKIGVYDIVYNHYYFQAHQDPERKKFYETAVKGKDVWISLEEGIRRVRKGLFAFHVEVGAGYQLMQETYEEDEKCGIHAIDYLNLLKPSLVVQYQSPYLEIIRVGALWVRETGLQTRETSRLYTDKPVCHGHNSFLSVGITECYAALMTMAYGTGVTFGVLLLEIIWHKWTSNVKEEIVELDQNAEFIE